MIAKDFASQGSVFSWEKFWVSFRTTGTKPTSVYIWAQDLTTTLCCPLLRVGTLYSSEERWLSVLLNNRRLKLSRVLEMADKALWPQLPWGPDRHSSLEPSPALSEGFVDDNEFGDGIVWISWDLGCYCGLQGCSHWSCCTLSRGLLVHLKS